MKNGKIFKKMISLERDKLVNIAYYGVLVEAFYVHNKQQWLIN